MKMKLKRYGLLTTCCSVFLSLIAGFHAQAADRPNIVLILADDLGYGDLGCFGGTSIATPNLDRMAAEGMRLTRHYAGSTVCAPSRCVLLTGLHTGHCRVRGNSPGIMHPEDITVAELLHDAGYATGCAGKWGVGAPPPLDDPQRNGFDHFFGYISMWHAHNFYPEFLIRNGKHHPLRNEVAPEWKDTDGRGVAIKRVDYAPDLITDDAVKFIETNKDGAFFLYFALNVPHANNEAGRFSDRPEKGMEVPDFGPFADKDWPGPEKGFAAMLHNIDRDIGRILETLKRSGIDENTLVIFTSDNGPHEEGGHQMEFFNSNGPLRGMKRDLYEGGVRVPTIARWPGKIEPGTESDHLSGFQDMLPTFAELAGASVPQNIDGLSMVPTLLGKADQQARHEFLYWEFSERGGKRGVVTTDWKLVQQDAGASNPPAAELFNLKQDVEETTNVADRHPDVVKQLTKFLDGSHVSSESYPLFHAEQKTE